jgi:1-acyl-sn-glycerol-3-phosphate acyltransferase
LNVPQLRARVPQRGNALSRALGRLYLVLGRWRFEVEIPDLPKAIFIVAPHTSNWDFPVGFAATLVMGLRCGFLGKHSLFRGPLGSFLRWAGGVPVDRQAAEGVVFRVAESFEKASQLMLAITPEGTRTRAERWKTGFHRIARAAEVPLIPVGLDWARRVIRFEPPFLPTDDLEGDLRTLRALFAPSMALRPDNFA